MARPVKTSNNKRIVMVRVRLTTAENTTLNGHAQNTGCTVSDYIREKTLSIPPRIVKATPDRAALIKHLSDLGRIGNNINQIAKALNSSEIVPEKDIAGALDAVVALSKLIHKQLGYGD